MNEEKLMTSDIIYDYVRNNVGVPIYDVDQRLLGYLIGFTLSGTIPKFLILAISPAISRCFISEKFMNIERSFGPFRVFDNRVNSQTKVYIPDMKKCYFINGEPVYNHIK